ncbi:heat stress transcription factor B-4-like protein, partial [Tanacetum coccineum]
STNPNTTVKIAVKRNTDPSLPTRVFQRIYVCLGALKVGFKACRKGLLGLNGAFMKGPFPGQVLVAVGLDLNNRIYPLAYALVEAETKSSWCWFLQCLGDDIDLHPNSNFTFMSDRQKVFNGKIFGGRDKPVITLLKYIREYCMKRIVNAQGVIDKCTGPLTPTATRIMKSIKKEAHLMKVQWNGANKYQVSGSLDDQCVVDVVTRIYSCRKCKLTWIPCKHVGAACWNIALNDRVAPPLEAWHISQSSASRQAQQAEPAVGQDGSGRSSVGTVIGLSDADGAGTAGGASVGVGSHGSSHSRWKKRIVQTERMSPQKRTPTQPAS